MRSEMLPIATGEGGGATELIIQGRSCNVAVNKLVRNSIKSLSLSPFTGEGVRVRGEGNRRRWRRISKVEL